MVKDQVHSFYYCCDTPEFNSNLNIVGEFLSMVKKIVLEFFKTVMQRDSRIPPTTKYEQKEENILEIRNHLRDNRTGSQS